MSNLQPSILVLDKGLNLQTAKIVAPPGSVLDSLNYEQVDFQGQKRIDGFTRYDGKTLAAIDEYYSIVLESSVTWSVGDMVGVDDGLLGIVVGADGSSVIYLAAINFNLIPEENDILYKIVDGENTDGRALVAIYLGSEDAATADEHHANLIAYNEVLRERVEELPGSVIGLHWFRDRLYAVADVITISLDGTTPAIYPGDNVSTASSPDAKVLDVVYLDNTRVVFLNAMVQADWEAGEVLSNSDTLAVLGTIAGFETLTTNKEIASFYESRSEAQTLEEDAPGPYDFGWRFVDLGWEVDFEEGVSLFGSLPSLNQNIDGLDVQGPTGVTGTNGAPLALLQKVDITNKPTQANGWKSSDTPTSYNLDPLAIRNVDTDYIYADAYISWDGDTGEVSAPGLTSGAVPEYAADSTVEITL